MKSMGGTVERLSCCCSEVYRVVSANVMVCSDVSQKWSNAFADDITSMKETMRTLLQLDFSDGTFISVTFLCNLVDNGVGKIT